LHYVALATFLATPESLPVAQRYFNLSRMLDNTAIATTPETPPKVVRIGRKIQAVLDELDQTPAWLAEMVGVSRSTITRILKGERNPTPETIQEIAPVLGLTVAQLVNGTDAAERVKEAKDLVARSDFEDAIRHCLEYERSARDAGVQLRDTRAELETQLEATRRANAEAREASERLARMEAERDDAIRAARHHEEDARRYQDALKKAVTDVARLHAQVRELGKAVDDGRKTGRIGAILAGVAAAVSVATYLNSDSQPKTATSPSPPPAQKKAKK